MSHTSTNLLSEKTMITCTPPDIDDLTVEEKCEIAGRDGTDISILLKLAKDKSITVKEALLDKVDLHALVIYDLAHDSNPDVRYQIASNPYVSGRILRMLSEDENPYVAARALNTLERIKSELKLTHNYRDCMLFIKKKYWKLAS